MGKADFAIDGAGRKGATTGTSFSIPGIMGIDGSIGGMRHVTSALSAGG
jgi:hypothetical protein